MERRDASSILLLLSLEAMLLVAGLSAATSSGTANMDDIIRLPSDTAALVHGRIAVVSGERKHGEERPWKCCDKAVPGPTTEGTVWYCMDKVEHCTCDRCFELEGSHSYYCLDGYQGSDPGPTCSHDVPEERMVVVRRQERPWKCCDKAVPGPTTEGTVWYCMDKVEKCTCESCYELKDGNSHSYYCLDGYQGSDPGPTCSHE